MGHRRGGYPPGAFGAKAIIEETFVAEAIFVEPFVVETIVAVAIPLDS